jgi:hypothetical protein
MTTAAPDTERPTSTARCGCCGRALPASRLTELGSTPGVFICTSAHCGPRVEMATAFVWGTARPRPNSRS